MIFLNIAIGIFTVSIFLAIIGFADAARYCALASGVFALTFVVLAVWSRLKASIKRFL